MGPLPLSSGSSYPPSGPGRCPVQPCWCPAPMPPTVTTSMQPTRSIRSPSARASTGSQLRLSLSHTHTEPSQNHRITARLCWKGSKRSHSPSPAVGRDPPSSGCPGPPMASCTAGMGHSQLRAAVPRPRPHCRRPPHMSATICPPVKPCWLFLSSVCLSGVSRRICSMTLQDTEVMLAALPHIFLYSPFPFSSPWELCWAATTSAV